MTSFSRYGLYYDLLYQDKDYEKEVDFLEEIFRRHAQGPVSRLLDAGCGTGGHALPLARRGYRVVGVDASSVMVERAREKAQAAALDISFLTQDLAELRLKARFDLCISMFAIMNYVAAQGGLERALRRIREHLVDGGLFVFDCWNGLAVLRTLPSVRIKEVEGEGLRVMRLAQPELDAPLHLCLVNFRLLVSREGKILEEVEETHRIRFLFPLEIAHYLEDAGFEVLSICPFLDLGGQADENAWNMTVIARAKKEVHL